mmetsp:Transcript_39130/g.103897  ORF Transcript_39130/g.103897 Transcript_39130/m.103897 type:complete len:99 (+) Transcript_39130:180-476(+)
METQMNAFRLLTPWHEMVKLVRDIVLRASSSCVLSPTAHPTRGKGWCVPSAPINRNGSQWPARNVAVLWFVRCSQNAELRTARPDAVPESAQMLSTLQ